MQKVFKRDKRSPSPLTTNTSRSMSGNKSSNTKPELLIRKLLRSEGLIGYRLHKKDLPGRPDIVFTKKKVAIFIHGCFWHRCPSCNYSLPKHNTTYWQTKFDRNRFRDINNENLLTQNGWTVLTIWECEIKKSTKSIVESVRLALA